MSPREGRWRIFIVDPADRMNPESQNALLKTLEEPTGRALLVLVAARAHALLPTVRSRCLAVRFAALPVEDLAAALSARGMPAGEALTRAALAAGCPGTALALDVAAMRERRDEVLAMLEGLAGNRRAIADLPAMAKTLAGETEDDLAASFDLIAALLRDAARGAAGSSGLVHADRRERLAALGGILGIPRAAGLVARSRPPARRPALPHQPRARGRGPARRSRGRPTPPRRGPLSHRTSPPQGDRPMKRTWIAATALTTCVLVGAAIATRGPSVVVAGPGGKAVSAEPKDQGLEFRLSEGVESGGTYERAPVAAAQPLSEADTKRLLDRLPPVQAQAADQADFALRESSLPAPRTGATVKEPFPPPAPAQPAPDAGAAGPLQVLRQLPSGDVPLAPHVSLTFSQPMVAVTSQAEAEKLQPAELRPLPPGGRWRWVGTKTLLFEVEPRLPMATEFTLTVPAGTRSATSGVLAKAASFTFRTPPPTLRSRWPTEHGPARRDTLVFAAFDQRVEPQALLQALQVRAGQRPVRVRLATAEEIEADEQVRSLARSSEPGRFVAFRAVEPLPADAAVNVTFEAGTPSEEGPRRTTVAQSWSFRTYGPLKVTQQRCGWDDQCRPFMPWQVQFSNPLDARAFRKEMVRVEPPVPGLKVSVHGNTLSIQGASRGRTVYRVMLAADIPDTFGQTLGTAQTVTFTVGAAEPWLTWTGGNLTVLDPAARPALSIYTVGVPELRVQAWAVKPADWPAYASQMGRRREKGATMPGQSVLSTVVRVQGEADELTETRVDLRSVFPSGLGHAVVRVEPTTQPKEEWRRLGMQTWVEATHIGLSAAVDARELLGWASDLADGRPLEGVELSLGPGGPSATTGADGLARMTLATEGGHGAVLVARRGQDEALLPHNVNWWNGGSGWQGGQPQDRLLWYVADDRGLYRPGEKVSVKGWLRRTATGPQGDVGLWDGAPRELGYVLRDSRNNEVTKGRLTLNALGGFDLKLDLPPTMNLGGAQLTLESGAHRRGLPEPHPRVPGAGVPPARVRGQGRGQRGAARRGSALHCDADGCLLRRRSAAWSRRELERPRAPRQLSTAEPRRLRLRCLRALVGALPPRAARAHADVHVAHRRLRPSRAAPRLRRGPPGPAHQPDGRGDRDRREPTGLDRLGQPRRPPGHALRRPAQPAPLRATGPAAGGGHGRDRHRRPARGGQAGRAVGRAAGLGAGGRRIQGGRGGARGLPADLGHRAAELPLRGEGGRQLPRHGARAGRARPRQRERAAAVGGGRPAAPAPQRREGRGPAHPVEEGLPAR